METSPSPCRRDLVLLEAAVLSAVENVSRHFVESVQNLARLGVDLADVLQGIVSEQAHEGTGNAVARAVDRRHEAPGVQLVEPGKVPTDAVPRHVQDELPVEDSSQGVAGQDGALMRRA